MKRDNGITGVFWRALLNNVCAIFSVAFIKNWCACRLQKRNIPKFSETDYETPPWPSFVPVVCAAWPTRQSLWSDMNSCHAVLWILRGSFFFFFFFHTPLRDTPLLAPLSRSASRNFRDCELTSLTVYPCVILHFLLPTFTSPLKPRRDDLVDAFHKHFSLMSF